LAQSRPDLDYPDRRKSAQEDSHPDNGDGDLRTRVLERRWQNDLVRSADPRGEDFWLAGYQVETGERTWYHLERNEWSIHFNVTRDGALFCGDGGDPGQVARAKDGQWIYLFRPELVPNRGIDDKSFVRPGVLRAERLVNMSKHQYRLEPNVSFTPDQKWVVFRSNMFGRSYVFAVEVARATDKVKE